MAQSILPKDEAKECKSNDKTWYKVTKIEPAGAIVTDIDLSTAELSNELIETIRSDVHKHQLLIFKNQAMESNHIIPPMKRLEIAKQLGHIVSSHYNHPNAPHRDIFRVSNDRQKGCLNVGRTGWHIDGTFLKEPYNYCMMHIISVPKEGFGETAFISSSSAIDHVLDKNKEWKEFKRLLDRLYFVGTSPNYAIHPMIYTHPATQRPTILMHLGMTSTFIEVDEKYAYLNIDTVLKLHKQKKDDDDEVLKVYNREETEHMLEEIGLFIEKCKEDHLMYKHQYEEGDLLISDNLAVIHEAVPSTQFNTNQIGLRIMDRITIGGVHVPSKN
eukprot:447468_1